MNNSTRPLILELEEMKAKIAAEINGAISKGIPCYLIKCVLETHLMQVARGAEMELSAARAQDAARAKAEETEE